ncbi:hypothetical protein [Helicobacter salomonis]|uniref:hypothetical protein n=1 Tax=Helicobacter salomonis TaxID=56878 RepID=UPI000CF12F38|nr:hypothetical protein [Helicobacter salomonis]
MANEDKYGKRENKVDVDWLLKQIQEDPDLRQRIESVLNKKALEMAWNHEEVKKRQYTFKEALEWIQKNFDSRIYSAANIMREQIEEHQIVLSCCFLDKNGNPLVGSENPFLRVETSELDQDLVENFGDENLIVVK